MSRVATLAKPFALGFDSVPFSMGGTKEQAAALKKWGMQFFAGYLGSVSPTLLDVVLASGLAFMPVTYADKFDGPACVKQLQALSVPKLTTVWLDLEGIKTLAPAEIVSRVNVWGRSVRAGGWDPGLYCGAGFQLSSHELGALTCDRYWLSGSDPIDRDGELARPYYGGPIGWSMIQLAPFEQIIAGVKLDVDVIQKDFRGRLPLWTIAA